MNEKAIDISKISPDSEYYAYYNRIQDELKYASLNNHYKVFSSLSPKSALRKTRSLLNIAILFGQDEYKTLFIDLDMRNKTLEDYFDNVNKSGISDYLTNRASKEEIINKSLRKNLDVIFSGSDTIFPSSFLESNKLDEFINELKEQYDYIFVNVAPLYKNIDAVNISRFVDAYLFNVALRKTKTLDIKLAMDIIHKNNLNVIGTIITNSSIKKKLK